VVLLPLESLVVLGFLVVLEVQLYHFLNHYLMDLVDLVFLVSLEFLMVLYLL
jgi:hypothetical protein